MTVLAGAAVLLLDAQLNSAHAQTTAFTYQGRLNDGTNPVTGIYDLTFALYNASSGGSKVGNTETNAAVGITNGLFTTTLDFGTVFDGSPFWVAIRVRTNGAPSFTSLIQRQPVTAAPYALFADTADAAGLIGTIPAADFSGTYGGAVNLNNANNSFTGDGTGLTNVNASLLGGLGVNSFWQTTGNAGTAPGVNFLGTSDNEPLIFRAYNEVGFQLQYASASTSFPLLSSSSGINLIGGYWGNIISNGVVGGTIAGGGYAFRSGLFHGSNPNTVTGGLGTVGGGAGNTAGNSATVPGGINNLASGYYSFAAGQYAEALHQGAFVWADSESGPFTSTTNDEFSIRANGGVRIQSDTGIHLNANDRPLVVRDWNPFAATAPSYKAGIGRWGLFMEPHYLTLGIPADDISGSYFQFAKYDTNGTPTQLAQVDQQGNLGLTGGLNVDANGLNIGNVNSNALTFGVSSGEGIASKRANGKGSIYDLEFWTDFAERMKIANNGNVGIGTDNPTATLDVNGEFMVVEGLGGVRCYLGDDGHASDVQIGSLTHGVTTISCYNATDSAYMHLNCSSITIEGGADLAEPFAINPAGQPVSEGEVVVIDEAHPGQLTVTDQPYDTHVAGVVSGANGVHPGIQMQQQGLLDGGRNVALTGRVYVQADTCNGAIRPGDLLTTSSTPGRAMRVSDHNRAQGAILGKAMTALKDGQGMVLVLVTLQ